jgi:streptomycin 6-kinase
VLRDLEQRWSLTLDAPFDGEEVSCSYVAAVVRADGTRAVLKIGMPHMEGHHEIHGLRFWDGDPTVRLLMADDDLGAMLLERCEPGTVLRALPEREQDVVISVCCVVCGARHQYNIPFALCLPWQSIGVTRRWRTSSSGPIRD